MPRRLPLLVTAALVLSLRPALAHEPDLADESAWILVQNGQAAPDQPVHQVSISVDGEYRRITSNGWPDHTPGQFPRRGNPNAITAQQYAFRVPVKPVVAREPQPSHGAWWGVAVNGVPFEPGTAERWNDDPRSGWAYEAGTGFLNLGLDEHHAHVQPTGAYHYHAIPTGLLERLGGDEKSMRLLGWAADGFPLYSGRGYRQPMDATSPLQTLESSYALKPGTRPEQAGGPGGNYDGRFTQDFTYTAGTGDLDECNGRYGVTPDFPEGTYYYCVTEQFPFLPRQWKGTPDPSFRKGPPPRGGPGGNRGGQRPGSPRGILPDDGAAPPVLDALDENRDGVIDAAELARAAASLQKLDKNGDGAISPEEYRGTGP